MEYRRLGSAGVRVSTLSLGGWINFEAKLSEEEARRIVARAYDGGVNFFDLADVYGHGEAERWLGGMLRDYPRHTLVVSTKVFFPMSSDVNDRGLSRKHVMESIHRSLRNLGTDYVDIYFCHRADPDTPLLETARAMDDLIRQGKAMYWGTSEWEPEEIAAARELCDRCGLHPPQVEQPQYSMLARERVERRIIPVAEPLGVGLVVYSPLAMGMLTGKYDSGIPLGSRFDREAWSKDRYVGEANARKVARLRPVADALGISRAQLALAWVLRQPAVTSAILGATTARQLDENLGAVDVVLDAGALDAIERALADDE
jgi:voltage-dependent potassium channel beta subunit